MMRNISAYVFVVAASLAGCAPTGDVEYAGEVRVTSPELVTISPGVQVVADADEPLFYSDGHYWLYRDGFWYRSGTYRGGFARVELTYLPEPIRVIERPQTYVQYRRHAGRDRHARDHRVQTRSQPQRQQPTTTYTQPTNTQQQPAPTYTQPQAPATSVPSQPDTYEPGHAHPSPRPDGINPQHTHTAPPAAVTPNNPSERVPPPAPGNRVTHPNGPGNSGNAPGNNTTAPGNRGNAPGHSPHAPGNSGPDERPHDDTNKPASPTRDHRSNQGNPSAPSRVAPTTPTNRPASPSTGATKAPEKDKHDHDAGNEKY